jgi:predicted RNA-binding Zn-ribbon protein involved in translation (DUF1610 family)
MTPADSGDGEEESYDSAVHVRACPECGEEFRPEIVRCSDCGAMLEDRWEGEEAGTSVPSAPVPPPEEAPGTYVVIYASDRAADLEPVAARLGGAGLPFRVKAAAGSFVLLAREEDRERLTTCLGDLLGEPTGSSAHEGGSAEHHRCPACDHELAANAAECPECGLVVGGPPEGESCPQCGRPLTDPQCPHCSPGGSLL